MITPELLDAETGECGIWGRILPSGLYEPTSEDDEDALGLVLLGIATLFEEPYDIVSWRPAEPRVWWLRTGRATHLGDHRFLRRDPVWLVETPAAYLYEMRGAAVCILDWERADLVDMFEDGPPVRFATERLRRRFDARWAEQAQRLAMPRYKVVR